MTRKKKNKKSAKTSLFDLHDSVAESSRKKALAEQRGLKEHIIRRQKDAIEKARDAYADALASSIVQAGDDFYGFVFSQREQRFLDAAEELGETIKIIPSSLNHVTGDNIFHTPLTMNVNRATEEYGDAKTKFEQLSNPENLKI